MKNSEYWRNLNEFNAKRKRWKDRQVDKSVDIPPPLNKTSPAYAAFYEFLNTLEIGDSFVIEKDEYKSGAAQHVSMARKIGKKLTSRKIYHDDDPNEFHYRVWYVADIEPVDSKKKKTRKPYDVVHRQDPAIGNYDACMGKLPNDILFLAEQNEENRQIVEDIRRLNRILIEELAKQNIKLPKQGE
tara:strand:+ start:104 stop:661 length:558 start_codon:yes stop_codon:yes gene_type:complete